MKLGLVNALIASVLGHTAALAVWPTAPETAELPKLHVQLQQPPTASGQEAEVAPKPEPRQKLTRERIEASREAEAETERASRRIIARATAEPRPELREEPEPASKETNEKTSEPPPVVAAPAPSTTPRPLILARLHDALHAHFSYPMLARRHGWEGQVTVGFRLEGNGRIDDVHVARSSGYGVLDRSAVDALSRVGGLPDVETGGRTFELQIPVIYRLQEG